MARSASFWWLFGLGFLCLGGGFVAGAVRVMQPEPPPAFAKAEALPDPEETVVYVPFEEQLAVAVPEQKVRVMLTLALALRGHAEELETLKAAIAAKRPAILAGMLVAAQDEVVGSVDPVELLARLPAPLKAVVNEALRTEATPAPVSEVLITGLVTQ